MADEKVVAPDFEFDLEDIVEVGEPETVETVETPKEEQEEVVETVKEEESTEETEESVELPKGADPEAYGIYKTLVDKGYTVEDKNFAGTYEALNEVFEQLPESIFQGVFQTFKEPLQETLRYAYAKGDEVTWKDLSDFINKHSPVNVESLDLSTVDKKKEFLLAELKAEGKDEDDAQDMIDLWEDKNKIDSQAEKYLNAKKKASSSTEAVEQAEAEKAAKKERAKQFTESIKTEVNSTQWKADRKQKVINEIFTGSLNEKSKTVKNHPKALTQLADFFTYFDPKKGEFNLEAYAKQGAAPAAKEIKDNIQRHFRATSKAVEVNQNDKKIDTSNLEFDV